MTMSIEHRAAAVHTKFDAIDRKQSQIKKKTKTKNRAHYY